MKSEIKVRLLGKNPVAKTKLTTHGEWWSRSNIQQRVNFSKQPGPWWLLVSLSTKATRWVNTDNDQDFFIMQVE